LYGFEILNSIDGFFQLELDIAALLFSFVGLKQLPGLGVLQSVFVRVCLLLSLLCRVGIVCIIGESKGMSWDPLV